MSSIEIQIAQAEQRVKAAEDAIAMHSQEWRGAERNTTFARDDMKRKKQELADAEATLYNLRAQKPVKSNVWKLAYIA